MNAEAGLLAAAAAADARSSLLVTEGCKSDIMIWGKLYLWISGCFVVVDVLGFRYLLSHSPG
jgi:hypothetical protein